MSETVTKIVPPPRLEEQNLKVEKQSTQTALAGTDIESNDLLTSTETHGNLKGKHIIRQICLKFALKLSSLNCKDSIVKYILRSKCY